MRQEGGEAASKRRPRSPLAGDGTSGLGCPRGRGCRPGRTGERLMRAELLQLAAEFARKGEPFVLAMVVRRESYSSAQQGDMALITKDGSYHGWLGGNCTQPTVKREARRALLDGRPRLISLSPEPSREQRAGITALPMTCQSGGSVDI